MGSRETTTRQAGSHVLAELHAIVSGPITREPLLDQVRSRTLSGSDQLRDMSDPAQIHHLSYARYEDFLNADSRRRGNALELGNNWRDGALNYRACWYEETGELTAERLTDRGKDLEDFHGGVSGPIHILGRVPDRRALTALLGEWPSIAPGEPRTLQRLRHLTARTGSLSA